MCSKQFAFLVFVLNTIDFPSTDAIIIAYEKCVTNAFYNSYCNSIDNADQHTVADTIHHAESIANCVFDVVVFAVVYTKRIRIAVPGYNNKFINDADPVIITIADVESSHHCKSISFAESAHYR